MPRSKVKRKNPNILVTGTPGVGKSKLCSKVSKLFDLKWHDVSAIAKKEGCIEEHDEELDCPVLDEDKLIDFLEPLMADGGAIVEYHGCNFFPERWFDVVYVIRCDNTILFDRLEKRNYNTKKLQSNVECEIFQTILEEAQESYEKDIIFELHSHNDEDMETNVESIKKWLAGWRAKGSE